VLINVLAVKYFYFCLQVSNCFTCLQGGPKSIDREFEFYEFFSFLKFNEFYEFFSVEEIRKKFVILQIVDV